MSRYSFVGQKHRWALNCVTNNARMAIFRTWRKISPHRTTLSNERKKRIKKMIQRTNMRKKLTTGIEFPGTIRLHPQAATVREREFSATFACVIPVGYDLITRSAINLRWIIVTIFSIYAGRRRGQWITEPFLSHDLRANVLCIPFTKGKGCVRGLRKGQEGRGR